VTLSTVMKIFSIFLLRWYCCNCFNKRYLKKKDEQIDHSFSILNLIVSYLVFQQLTRTHKKNDHCGDSQHLSSVITKAEYDHAQTGNEQGERIEQFSYVCQRHRICSNKTIGDDAYVPGVPKIITGK
jgi:hypothetical protein